MSLQLHPYSVALGSAAVVAGAAGLLARRRRAASQAAPALCALMAGLAVWSGTYAAGWAATSRSVQLTWLNLTYFGVAVVPTAFLIFALRLTGSTWPRRRSTLAWLAVVPAAIIVAVWWNPAHLFYTDVATTVVHGRVELTWTRGPLFWMNAAYGYAVLVAGCKVLGRGIRTTRGPYRRQRLIMLGAAAIPWIANFATVTGLWRLGSLDTTPVAFTASGALIAWALLRERLLDLVPVARGILIETMADGVVVIDHLGRIADVNPAAERLVRSIWPDVTDHLIGARAADIWEAWPAIVGSHESLVSRHVGDPDDGRELDIQVTDLGPSGALGNGTLLVIRDVTDRDRAHRRLEEANAALRRQLVEIEHLRSQLADEATHDPLTGLFNRRHLDDAFARELARADRDGSEMSVVVLDLDHFKDLNDRFGHSAGDRVLRDVASMLRKDTRTTDIACRWGGEEFVVILPGVGTAEAARLAGRWINALPSSTTDDQDALVCTLSAGVATFPSDGTTADRLFRSADRALYAAKQAGRAQVASAADFGGAWRRRVS